MLQMLQATIGTTHRSVILFGALIEIDSVILRRVDHSGKEPRDITTKPYWIRVVYRIGGRYGVDISDICVKFRADSRKESVFFERGKREGTVTLVKEGDIKNFFLQPYGTAIRDLCTFLLNKEESHYLGELVTIAPDAFSTDTEGFDFSNHDGFKDAGYISRKGELFLQT